jgi:hypothetical protein
MPADWPTSPALNDTYVFAGITYRWNGSGWVVVATPGVAAPSRLAVARTVTVAAAATATDTIALAKTFQPISIGTDGAAWVRLYSSAAASAADSSRLATQDPAAGAGIILEVTTTGAQVIGLTPTAPGSSTESTPGTSFPIRVTNNGGGSSITVTITYVPWES